ncbi:ependymin-related protein 1-like [Haliotis rufescens]|uniref:ependymin-related protein 1-like n=1 Tax=Haliotis rufescens TaxID=6454 RepID=UPI00201F5C70|nr:ependymin-related protein 1-like [Haliotis rufescens]
MILQAALLLAGLSVTASAGTCCPVVRFSAVQSVTIVNSTFAKDALYSFTYDGINQRYVISGDLSDGFVTTTKVIYDYPKKTGYCIDTMARTCSTFRLQGKFKNQESVCVPSDAVSLGPFFFGYGVGRLSSTAYTYNSTTVNGEHQKVVALVSRKDCVPIVITTTTTGPGGNALKILGYNDVVPGISDFSVFDIPAYCSE